MRDEVLGSAAIDLCRHETQCLLTLARDVVHALEFALDVPREGWASAMVRADIEATLLHTELQATRKFARAMGVQGDDDEPLPAEPDDVDDEADGELEDDDEEPVEDEIAEPSEGDSAVL